MTVSFFQGCQPLARRTFSNHDLPLLVSLDEDVAEVCVRERLNKSQAKALQGLKKRDGRKVYETAELTPRFVRPARGLAEGNQTVSLTV